MSRKLWGAFVDDDEKYFNTNADKSVSISAKKIKLDEMHHRPPTGVEHNSVTVKIKNPLVTQTIEVMKQTEMLQSLIDTYSNKSGTSNYLLNPCQMIPEVDFPPENAANFIDDDEKFQKPIWFTPAIDSPFVRGVPQQYPQINNHICRAALRKAVCGQLRVAGFTDTAESALVLFADAIQEFMRNLVVQLRVVQQMNAKLEKRHTFDVSVLEQAYFALTHMSLTQVHNYFKHNLIARNRTEISEFNDVLQEYDKLQKESQSMQKEEFQGDFLNILEMPQSGVAMLGGPIVGDMLHEMNGGGGTSTSSESFETNFI